MTPAEAKQWLEANHIKYILAQFVDIHGSAKAKAVPAEHLEMVLTDGAGFGAEGFIRISYATSLDRLQEGVARIKRVVERGSQSLLPSPIGRGQG